jgi:hypothetical protein
MKTKIKVECVNNTPGTLNWFNEVIKDHKFVISNEYTLNGEPVIYLKIKYNINSHIYYGTLCDDKSMVMLPVCKKDDGGFRDLYSCTEDGYLTIVPQRCELRGLVDFPITPATYKAIEDLINKAKDIFKNWWENEEIIDENTEIRYDVKKDKKSALICLKEYLKNGELIICNRHGDNKPHMLLKVKKKNDKEDYIFLCSKYWRRESTCGLKITKDGYIIKWPKNLIPCSCERFVITPECEEEARKFLDTAKNKFKNWFEKQ